MVLVEVVLEDIELPLELQEEVHLQNPNFLYLLKRIQ
jgi:hypothetical protein